MQFDGIGLFFSPAPMDRTTVVQMFEMNALNPETGRLWEDDAIKRMLCHYACLDARRFEESGLRALNLDPARFGAVVAPLEQVMRPESPSSRRIYAVMETTDVICFN